MSIKISKINELYCGVIYDTMVFDLKIKEPFLLSKKIKPVWNITENLFGPAFTCKGSPVLDEKYINDRVRIDMFKHFYEGCVQVISSGGMRNIATFGDISGKIAKKFGAIGAVMDAPTRDVRLIENDRFMVFSEGSQCVDAYGKWQITEFEVPIYMPGIQGTVRITPGDYVFGDKDGVIIIPQEKLSEIIDGALARLERENIVRKEIHSTEDIQMLYDKVGRW